MPNKVRVCVIEAEEGTVQQKLWVAMEGQWGDSKEEKKNSKSLFTDVDHGRHWAMGVHISTLF